MADGKQVDGKVLVALIREAGNAASKVAEINGSLGDRIKHHKEHSNLHTGAFAVIKRAHRMEELKRDELKAAIDLYWDIAERELWSKHTGDLADMASDADEADDDPDGQDADAEAAQANQAALRKGITQLPEDADDKPKPGERRRVKRSAGGDAAGSYKLN